MLVVQTIDPTQTDRSDRNRRGTNPPGAGRPTLAGLLRVPGGRRYALALGVDALGAGLLRPFMLLYGVIVLDLSVGRAGLTLSAGVLAGLLGVPLTGRWIDRGARTAPIVTSLVIRTLGVAVLLGSNGSEGFLAAAVLLGIGNQSWNPAHGALVATLVQGRTRDAALAATRSLRNAGLGAGALVAILVVAGGPGALRALAAVTAVAYVAAAAIIATMRVAAQASIPPRGPARPASGKLPGMRLLGIANVPFALCFDVLEVALPAVLVLYLHASSAWSAGIFVANTILVITIQLPVVLWLSRYSRRSALAGAGILLAISYAGFAAAGHLGGLAGPIAVAAVSVLYTFGEIVYTGSGTALVTATAPPHELGKALARWQLSTGIGQAIAPAALAALLSVSPDLLWGTLCTATVLAAAGIRRWAPTDGPRAAPDVARAV